MARIEYSRVPQPTITANSTFVGSAYAYGYDSTGQLGLGLKDDDDKVVPTPQKVQSAHLDGYNIINISLGDQHSIFLAQKQQ